MRHIEDFQGDINCEAKTIIRETNKKSPDSTWKACFSADIRSPIAPVVGLLKPS